MMYFVLGWGSYVTGRLEHIRAGILWNCLQETNFDSAQSPDSTAPAVSN